MKRLRWSTTLLLIGASAACLALAAFAYPNRSVAVAAMILAAGCILLATLFGKQSV